MIEDEDFFDHYEDDCWNCNGEGFVSHCFQEFACIYPDEGCELCMRRCDFCNPAPRNPELDALLSEMLAAPQGDRSPEGEDGLPASSETRAPVPEGDAPNSPPVKLGRLG